VDRMDDFYAFHFYDDQVLDEQVYAVSQVQLFAFIDDGHPYFLIHSVPSLAQFMREAGCVSALKQSGTENGVHFKRGVNDASGDLVDPSR